MTSLTKDGGTIPLMAVKIHRIYPLAFMSKEKGKGTAPWSEAEEFTLQEEWTVSQDDCEARAWLTWLESPSFQQRYNQERERLQEACDVGLWTARLDDKSSSKLCATETNAYTRGRPRSAETIVRWT